MTMTHEATKAGGARYVFAGRETSREDAPTKVCPRCGQELFADMDVCYGCLYDFSKDVTTSHGAGAGHDGRARPRQPMSPTAHDPLAGIELDEPADDDAEGHVVPRHRRQGGVSAEDTVDLSEVPQRADATAVEPTAPSDPRLVIRVRTPDLEVDLPLGSAGLAFGRDLDNDVMLLSRSVSRHHLMIEPRPDGGATVRDCGSTNPAELHGEPLSGEAALAVGDELSVCGTTLQLLSV